MKFKGIQKGQEGHYITRYDLLYETKDGKDKTYEMISRDPDMHSFQDLTDERPKAVVMILTDEEDEHILLNHEFRLATGRWVYNFPAGLIDPGEMPEKAAARELKEETGLKLTSITDELGLCYSSVGFSNETNVCIIGTAAGEFAESTSSFEEIEAGWYTRDEVIELIRHEPFAARSQAYCYAWATMSSSRFSC